MVCVCPPHTSISLYWRPGSHSAVIFADSACAVSASRNSSTNRMTAPLFDPRVGQRRELVVVGLADPLQELHGGGRLGLIDLRQREADMDEHPFAGLGRVIGQQADVDDTAHAAHVHPGEVGLIREELDHLTGYAEAHRI